MISHPSRELARYFKEDRYGAETQTKRSPEVLYHEVFHEPMVKPATQYTIDVFDQCEVTLV